MSELLSESLVPFYQAAADIPGRPHMSTLHRWRSQGIRGMKLETILVGGRRFTSREALQRFFENVAATVGGVQPAARTVRKRRSDHDAATARLRKAGVLK